MGDKASARRARAHTYEGHIVVLGRPQAHRQDPVGERALDDRPGHDTAPGRLLDVPGGPRRGVPVDDVPEVVCPGDPFAILEDLGLESHAGLFGYDVGN